MSRRNPADNASSFASRHFDSLSIDEPIGDLFAAARLALSTHLKLSFGFAVFLMEEHRDLLSYLPNG
jgi:hypothetical protein